MSYSLKQIYSDLCLYNEDTRHPLPILLSEINLIEDASNKRELNFKDVKIIPAQIVFAEAYEGKTFEQTVEVINCGRNPAMVQFSKISSSAFLLKWDVKPKWLPSGLSVKKKIRYSHVTAMAIHQGVLQIYINEQLINVKIMVTVSEPHMKLFQSKLDFGVMDVAESLEVRTMQMYNGGNKVGSFIIDLPGNELELNVDPMKGTVQPLETVVIKVELMGFKEGQFLREFWIKSYPPQFVQITGTFIIPKLIPIYPDYHTEFVIIDFGKTYYGVSRMRHCIIKNDGCKPVMFYTKAQHKKQLLKVALAHEIDGFRFYTIYPVEGRLQPFQFGIINVTFAPVKDRSYHKKFAFASFKLFKITAKEIQKLPAGEDLSLLTLTEETTNAGSTSEFSLTMDPIMDVLPITTKNEEEYIRILVHGEMEQAAVEFHPDSFNLKHLSLNQKHQEVVSIKNSCTSLPIVFKYKKAFSVEVDPTQCYLKPLESVDVALTITPVKMGLTETLISFDLVFKDFKLLQVVGSASFRLTYTADYFPAKKQPVFLLGITPINHHEVGKNVEDVRFNTKCDQPTQAIVDRNFKQFNKNNCDLIALPNDRAASVRPWNNAISCRTIFANMPRHITIPGVDGYSLSVAEKNFKDILESHYNSFIRPKKTKISVRTFFKEPEDYEISDTKALLMKHFDFEPEEKVVQQFKHPSFIPLSPEMLLNIFVYPKSINLEKIVPNAYCSGEFTVSNKNPFKIHMVTKSMKKIVYCSMTDPTIKANQTKSIPISFKAQILGRYCVPIHVIINQCHEFNIMVFADVVNKTLRCNVKNVVIKSQNELTYLELSNDLNVEIPFQWTIPVQESAIQIHPSAGIVPPRNSIICYLSLASPRDNGSTEITLNAALTDQTIKVRFERKATAVAFDSDVVLFENIAVNKVVTKELVCRNFLDELLFYSIDNPSPVKGISITPFTGILHSKSNTLFTVTVCFKSALNFDAPVTFKVQDKSFTIRIVGNTVFPQVAIYPGLIQLMDLVAFSIQKQMFELKNNCPASTRIRFLTNIISEIAIMDLGHNDLGDEEIIFDSKETKQFYIEFRPQKAGAYSFLLPIQINNVLGPSVANDGRTFHPKNFMEQLESNECLTYLAIPNNLPLLRLNLVARDALLTFSSLHLQFYYHEGGAQKKQIVVRNISEDVQKVWVDFKSLHPAFRGVKDDSITSTIEPDEEAVLEFTFDPNIDGVFTSKCPVFVKNRNENCIFNVIKLQGTRTKASIVPMQACVTFETVPTNIIVEESLKLDLVFHQKGCELTLRKSIKNVTVSIGERVALKPFKEQVVVSLYYSSSKEYCLDKTVEFVCSCGAQAGINLRGCTDNCILTSYNYILANSEFKVFDADGKVNEKYFITLESWLYHQGFMSRKFYKIPEGISAFPVDIVLDSLKNPAAAKKKAAKDLPLFELLINLGGIGVKKFIKTDLAYSENVIDRTLYAYTTYRNILVFLKTQKCCGLFFPPEMLLTYQNYKTFKTRLHDEHASCEDPLIVDEVQYEKISIRCWFDVILQIFKVFVLNRIEFPKPAEEDMRSIFDHYYAKHIGDYHSLYRQEAVLLLWSEFHFNKQKSVLWKSSRNPAFLAPVKLESFNKAFKNSLIFAAITAAYCPYLVTVLKEMYIAPTCYDQYMHNASRLIQAWKKINVSYYLEPFRIVFANPIEIVMLLTYLYQMLPTLVPIETVIIEANLSKTSGYNITLTNTGDSPIAYKAILFNNSSNMFELENETITMAPKKQSCFKIKYHARSMFKVNAILLLIGETGVQKFGKNLSFTLVGVPNTLEATIEIPISATVYKEATVTLELESPYKKSYTAEYYLALRMPPQNFEDLVSWTAIKSRNMPRQFTISPNTFVFNEAAILKVKFTYCFAVVVQTSYYIFLTNETVGDFCIKFNVMVSPTKKGCEKLYVNLGAGFNLDCICKNNQIQQRCPKCFVVKIPCKNSVLWKGLLHTIKTCSEEPVYKFWRKYLEIPTGYRLLRMFADNTDNLGLSYLFELGYAFVENKHYEVRYDKKASFRAREDLVINDITRDDTKPFLLHWNAESLPQVEILRLDSNDGREVRYYKMIFNRQED